MSLGFIVIAVGAQVALSEGLAGAKWLLLTYLFHTIGELILSPIGLAAISSLSPKRFIAKYFRQTDNEINNTITTI